MFFFFDIFMAKISRFNELQAVIAGKILIPGNLGTKYLDCCTYGSSFASEVGKVYTPGPAGATFGHDADCLLGACLIIRAVSSGLVVSCVEKRITENAEEGRDHGDFGGTHISESRCRATDLKGHGTIMRFLVSSTPEPQIAH